MSHFALRTLAFAALLAAPSFADVYIVDDDGGPGVDFTDLPAAVAAAVPGDVLLVQTGSYSGFATSKGLAILAQSDDVAVTSATSLTNVPAGQTARLLGLEFTTLQINGCQGVVVLDGVEVWGDGVVAQALNIFACADVRGIGSVVGFGQFGPPPPTGSQPSGHALRTAGARVELVDTQLFGRHGAPGSGSADGGSGGHAAQITSGSRVHLVLSESLGGHGGNGSPLCFPTGTFGGDGGDGALVQNSSTLFAMGTPGLSKIHAGLGGGHCFPGVSGQALRLQSLSKVRHSGQSISGGTSVDATSTLETPALLDPYMERTGTLLVGTQVRFNVFGEAGDQVTLFLGRNAVVQPLPGVLVEKLTSEERAFPLGPIPAGGFATLLFNLPPTMTAGFTFYAQARVMRGSAELRTNSVPVVVR